MKFLKSSIMVVAILLMLKNPLYAISISPTSIKNNFKPGESSQGQIKVYNEGDYPLKVNMELSDWAFMKDGSGKVDFPPAGTTPYSCSDWIQITPTEFELEPKKSKEVTYTITFPIDTQGGSYAAVFAVGQNILPPPSPEEKTKAIMRFNYVARLAVLVYNEPLDTPKKVSLTKFDILRPNNKSLTISYEMRNEGLAYVKSLGKFHIMDDGGKLYGSGKFSDAKMRQGDTAQGKAEWLGELPIGEYSLIATLELGPFGDEVIVKEKKIKIDPSGLKILE